MSDSRWPDFLIVGAAKAGTTALYHQLGTHPDIFMSPQKEMNFFALENQVIDFKGPGDIEITHKDSILRKDEYLDLFRAGDSFKAIGEASPLYLSSESACYRIKYYIPKIKLIGILRNPIDRAFSAFCHLRRDEREPESNFLLAVEKEPYRITSGWCEMWHYIKNGLYADQIERFQSNFKKDQILFLVYENFLSEPKATLKTICDFLQIDSTFPFEIGTKYNRSGTPRFKNVHQMLNQPQYINKFLKRLFPKKVLKELRESIINLNLKEKESLTEDQIHHLYPFFEKDIHRIEKLINMDLSHWKPK